MHKNFKCYSSFEPLLGLYQITRFGETGIGIMEETSNDKKDGIFRYAEGYDKFLMFFGTLGSIGDGLQIPLMMYVLSDVINDYGNPNITISNSTVNKVIFVFFKL